MIPLPPISTLFPYTTLFRSTKEQEILIAKTIGCSRFVFNRFLGQWNDRYKETGKGLTYNSCSAELRSEEHTSELQSRGHLVCRLLLEKKNQRDNKSHISKIS